MLLKSLLPTFSLSLLLLSTYATITPTPSSSSSSSSSSFPFSNSTSNATQAAATTPAPTTTPAPPHCDITYCVNGTSYCHFWAGVTTWQMTGPSPGELVTTLGMCKLGRARPTAA
ncbi:hypothetical protein J3F83DRAFT_714648 [Trichoderma novae-zelandiae]